jgi:hypothetical protein
MVQESWNHEVFLKSCPLALMSEREDSGQSMLMCGIAGLFLDTTPGFQLPLRTEQ